jgi:hypothetical protein
VAGKDIFQEPTPAASIKNGTTFASVNDDIYDPACDDDAINKAKYCQPPKLVGPKPLVPVFMDASGHIQGEPEPLTEPINGLLFSLNPVGNVSNLACTQGFAKVRVGAHGWIRSMWAGIQQQGWWPGRQGNQCSGISTTEITCTCRITRQLWLRVQHYHGGAAPVRPYCNTGVAVL